MKYVNLSLVAALAISFSGAVNAAAGLTESFFFGKTYANDSSFLRFYKRESRKDPGFRLCTLNGAPQNVTECVWEYDARDRALIVWVNGNRDWWTVSTDGKTIREGSFVKRLVQ
ncbi:MAG TPA: hypothetical protein VFV50_15455 [Bdellovibrionales bacterium]|nr:hypothetical protein [Bdellovibrionales bacterium]